MNAQSKRKRGECGLEMDLEYIGGSAYAKMDE